MLRRHNRRRAATLAETMAGLMLLIPVVLFLIDVVALVIAQTANDALAKHCARAAAAGKDATEANTAAQRIISDFSDTFIVSGAQLVPAGSTKSWSTTQVTCVTQVTCTLPVPIPGHATQIFQADATEPVVGVLPP